MATKDDLSNFVRTALHDGRSRHDISAALLSAGWSQTEVSDALSAWAEVDFTHPVPRPTNVVSARDFFVHGLTFVLLAASAGYLARLLFLLIDLQFGDSDHTYWIANSVRWSIAGLIVTAPLYGWLTWRETRLEATNPGRSRSVIRNWLSYLTLLLTGLAFLGDVVWTLGSFLNGELTLVTGLRLAVVAVLSGAIFLYYLGKTKGAAA